MRQHDVSTFRLYVLRATYLLVVVGLATSIWPLMLRSVTVPPAHMTGVVRAVLTAVSLLALLGLRYPLRMLPLLMFELTWKTVWLLGIGLPLWRAGKLDGPTAETWFACLMGVVIFTLAMPWGYVWRQYVRAPSDRWRRAPRAAAESGLTESGAV